jgi:hypothetical protein
MALDAGPKQSLMVKRPDDSFSQSVMRIGEHVRIVKVPEDVVDQPGFPTRTLLGRCLGKIFPVTGVQKLIDDKGNPKGELLALDVGAVDGAASYLETVFIEPSCVEVVYED